MDTKPHFQTPRESDPTGPKRQRLVLEAESAALAKKWMPRIPGDHEKRVELVSRENAAVMGRVRARMTEFECKRAVPGFRARVA